MRRTTANPTRPTMVDVARLAGVSPTAVSFVINDRADGSLSDETQQRVRAAVAALGYRPNLTARSLRTRRTLTIGFVADRLATLPASGGAISGAHDLARRHGTMLMIVGTTSDPRVMRRAVEDLLDRQVDALVFSVVGTRRATLPEAARHVPTVLINCFPALGEHPCVLPDEATGGREATELLLELGHRRIAFLTGLPGSWATRQRIKGYRAALQRAGIGVDAALLRTGNFRSDSGYELAAAVVAERDPPTALLCGNDRMAVGAYFALKERGLDVPADVSVVGYDDQPDLAAEVHPPLTTVRLPYYEMGHWAVEQVFAGTIGELPARTFVRCPVVVRESTTVRPG